VRTVSVPGAIRADIVKHLLHRLHPVREVVEVCAAERAALRPGEHQRIRPVVDVGHQVLRRLARLHTRLPLLAFTPKPEVRSQLAMSWEGDVEGARAAYQRAIDSGPDQAPTAMRNLELLAQQGEK
jgi:hypothetical protein